MSHKTHKSMTKRVRTQHSKADRFVANEDSVKYGVMRESGILTQHEIKRTSLTSKPFAGLDKMIAR